jgi:hypothetical protein
MILDHVRYSCRAIAECSYWVRISDAGLERAISEWSALEIASQSAGLDPEAHYLEGDKEGVASYLLALDAINFGSGWFPTLRKRGERSGYYTIASSLADRFRDHGPWSPGDLRSMKVVSLAGVMDQDSDHPLMALYSEALRQLGRFLGTQSALDVIADAKGSAERLATHLRRMPFFDDTGFWKRAQITASDLAVSGIADFADLERLTIFADNLVPHVLRVDGVLIYEQELATLIDDERLLPPGQQEREIRACAVHACERIATGLGVAACELDRWLWNRGQEPRYKSRPRHRTRTVFY